MASVYGPSEPQLGFVYLVVGQMLLVVGVLASLDSLTTAHFVAVSFVTVLLSAELTAPLSVDPAWRTRLRWVLVGCLAVFGYVVSERVASLWV
jgi:hypothetical protein